MNRESNASRCQAKHLVESSYSRSTWSDRSCPEHFYDFYEQNINAKLVPSVLKEIASNENQTKEKAQVKLLLWLNHIGGKGCLYFSKFNNLEHLCLSENRIGDEGCRYLAKCKWSSLKKLHLKGNQIREKGCVYLTKASWSTLLQLHLLVNPVGRHGYLYLRDRYPKCQILCDDAYTPNQ